MAIRKLRYQDDPILRKNSRPIEIVDDKIKELAQDLIDTMHKYNGVGLAAVQVGVLKQIVVIQVEEQGDIYVLINPKILKTKGNRLCDERCLSFPDQFAKVNRPEYVEVEFTNLEGKREILKAKDLLAQAICHETDHLKGQVFTDIMEPGTLERINHD